jgi:signal peptidase I
MSAIADSPRKRRSGFAEFVSMIFWAIVIALVVQVLIVQSFTIPSASMEPTVDVGDYVFVDKYAYGYSRYSFSYGVLGLENGVIPFTGRILTKNPKRGEIVVFRNPKQLGVDFIKRVIGLPGDKIQMKEGVLIINGSPVERTFEKDFQETDDHGQPVKGKQYTETLSNGVSYHIWKTTDEGNANNTPVYEVPAGQFFVMGDNRDNSEDSRFTNELGFIPADNLIGRAWMIYFNHSGNSPIWQVWDWNTTVRKDRLFKFL